MYEYKPIKEDALIYLPYNYYLPLTSFPINSVWHSNWVIWVESSQGQHRAWNRGWYVCWTVRWLCKGSAPPAPFSLPVVWLPSCPAPPKINNLKNKRNLPTHVGDTSIPECPQSFPCHCFSQAGRLKLFIRTTPKRVALLAMSFCHWEKANEPCCGAPSIEMSFSGFTT